MADEVVNLVLRRVVGKALQELCEVLLPIEVVTTFWRVMHIPSNLLQLLEGREEIRRLAQGRDETFDHLLASQALHRIDGSRKTGGEQQGADLGGGLFAGLQVDDLSVCGLLCVPKILRDHVAHAGNLGELVADFRDAEVEVLRADQEHIVCLAIPDRAEQAGNQLDQSAGLLELLVFLEQRNDVLKPRMERDRSRRSRRRWLRRRDRRSWIWRLLPASGQRPRRYRRSRLCREAI